VAVAAVVLNRVRSASFPNTVSGVIYQRNAFSCVNNGSIENTPDSSCIRAALEALNGWDPTGGCLYFYNPKTAKDNWIRTRTTMMVIGNHRFAV
jgi:N-acetylmuramoyl-L-alanine amidase